MNVSNLADVAFVTAVVLALYAGLRGAFIWTNSAPAGYEDEQGFHYDE